MEGFRAQVHTAVLGAVVPGGGVCVCVCLGGLGFSSGQRLNTKRKKDRVKASGVGNVAGDRRKKGWVDVSFLLCFQPPCSPHKPPLRTC